MVISYIESNNVSAMRYHCIANTDTPFLIKFPMTLKIINQVKISPELVNEYRHNMQTISLLQTLKSFLQNGAASCARPPRLLFLNIIISS